MRWIAEDPTRRHISNAWKTRVLAEQTIEDSIAGVKAGGEAGILSLGIEHESDDARSLIFAGTKKVIMPPDNIPKALKYFE